MKPSSHRHSTEQEQALRAPDAPRCRDADIRARPLKWPIRTNVFLCVINTAGEQTAQTLAAANAGNAARQIAAVNRSQPVKYQILSGKSDAHRSER